MSSYGLILNETFESKESLMVLAEDALQAGKTKALQAITEKEQSVQALIEQAKLKALDEIAHRFPIMPANPVCYYDFEDIPEFPDNLNHTDNKHFCNWKKGTNIGKDNYYLYCEEPVGGENRRRVIITDNGIFIVETLRDSGFYISSYHTPNRIGGKLIIMRFRVIKGVWKIGIEGTDAKHYSKNEYATVSYTMPDTGAFCCYAGADSKIEITDIYIGDGSIKNNAVIDCSGNNNVLTFPRTKQLFSKTLHGLKGAYFRYFTYLQGENKNIGMQFTVSLWVSPDCLTNIFHHLFYVNSITPCVYNDCLYGYPNHFSREILKQGELYHIVCTGDEKRIHLYINNRLVGYLYNSNETIYNQVANQFCIGAYHYEHGFYNGFMAQVLIFDRVLTEQEILWLYLNPQYPIKNYTKADAQLLELFKNGYIQWNGMQPPDTVFNQAGYHWSKIHTYDTHSVWKLEEI